MIDDIEEQTEVDQVEHLAGRTPQQKRTALKAKKVRAYIAANPGCCSVDVSRIFGPHNCLGWLSMRNFIKQDMMTGGWSVVPL